MNHVWNLAVAFIKRVSRRMQIVESGSTLNNMAWCRRHTFVVNTDDKGGLHRFVYAFDCCVRLERFIIWVGTLELHPFDSSFLIGAQEALLNHQAPGLGIPSGRLVLWFSKWWWWITGVLFRMSLTPMGPSFVDYVLRVVNADHAMRVIEPPRDDLEGVIELPCPLESPPSTQVDGALSGIKESVHATPTPLKDAEQSI